MEEFTEAPRGGHSGLKRLPPSRVREGLLSSHPAPFLLLDINSGLMVQWKYLLVFFALPSPPSHGGGPHPGVIPFLQGSLPHARNKVEPTQIESLSSCVSWIKSQTSASSPVKRGLQITGIQSARYTCPPLSSSPADFEGLLVALRAPKPQVCPGKSSPHLP